MKTIHCCYRLLFGAIILVAYACCSTGKLRVEYVTSIENANHPQILMWMWDESTVEGKQYLKDVDRISAESPFDFVMLSSRFADDIGFYNTEKLHAPLKEMVEYAHTKGIKVGLQLWGMNKVHHLYLPDEPFSTEDAEGMIVDSETVLDARGRGEVTAVSNAGRQCVVFDSALFRAYLFRKTADGFYAPGSLVVPKPGQLRVSVDSSDRYAVTVTVDAGPEYAGYTAYIQTLHYFNYPDVFGPKHLDYFKEMLDGYADIPFDGMSIDEHGAMTVPAPHMIPAGRPFRERAYGKHFAEEYRTAKGKELSQTLLEMRYVEEGAEAVRVRAINDYFDIWRRGPLKVEQGFFDYSRKLFGDTIFSGEHSTYHGALSADDIWVTGISWWELPRHYGQSDEYHPTAEKMGIAAGASKPVMYNMFYHNDSERVYREAMNSAAIGVRLHYHAWNDRQGWGKDFSDASFLKGVVPVEERIRLLNRFNPAPPKLPVLVIYNFPYLLNWYPDVEQRGTYDIRNTDMQQISQKIWNAGISCAAVPSTYIDNGILTVTEGGTATVNGRSFDTVVFLYPQYAKKSTFAFLEKFVGDGGRVLVKGEASMDFDGEDVRERFNRLNLCASVSEFSPENLSDANLEKNRLANGIELSDGSVILSDYASIASGVPTHFSFDIGADTYTGSYIGVFALKTDENGKVEKLAGGGFQTLKRNGETILELEHPADILLLRKRGKYRLTVKGDCQHHRLSVFDL